MTATPATEQPGTTDGRRRRSITLGDACREFVRWPSPRIMGVLLIGAILAAVFAFPRLGLGLTFLVTIVTIGIVYEWIHHLVHTDYRPRRWAYRALWMHHRLHHYKNENYWFAFTATYPDIVFGTTPDPSTVETSPTVRDILGTALSRG